MNGSLSENHGIAALSDNDLSVYSVGISSAGVAEIRMATLNPKRHITATTIDIKGVADAKGYIAKEGYQQQITAKLEDVSKDLPYEDNHFDFIYARLVLHYLSKQQLPATLLELQRILKPKGKLYIVVRSNQCPDAIKDSSSYDPATGLTAYSSPAWSEFIQYRFFHTIESINNYVVESGFQIAHSESYDEQLYADFMRTKLAPHFDNVIELIAEKL